MKTWKLADIGTFLKNSCIAILQGQLLLRLKVGRFFIHIMWTFLLFGITIYISLKIDTTLAKVENNKRELKELEIAHSQKIYDIVNISRRSSVESILQEMGSPVKEAEQPAYLLTR